jgi:D-alanine-D-alanine ligase
MRVTVLRGGPSAEHDISMISGRAVAKGLRAAGHKVFEADIGPDDLWALDHPADVIFPVLHGAFGESGELQEILEARRCAFVGAGSKASRLGIDKVATKRAWQKAGLPTPAWELLTPRRPRRSLPAPCVVKAVDSGSSIDVHVCETAQQADEAIAAVLGKHPRVLVERYIQGPELTVGLLEEQPLAPIRIIPQRRFFDYQAKYRDRRTRHTFDTGLPARVNERCRELARRANAVVGAVDLARIDIMIDKARRPWLLEINTLPGFTPVSLLPEAAAHAGIGFPQLVNWLVCRAAVRGPRSG